MHIIQHKHIHLTSNCTDCGSDVPTEFCAVHVYRPASRRPTGLSSSDSYMVVVGDMRVRVQQRWQQMSKQRKKKNTMILINFHMARAERRLVAILLYVSVLQHSILNTMLTETSVSGACAAHRLSVSKTMAGCTSAFRHVCVHGCLLSLSWHEGMWRSGALAAHHLHLACKRSTHCGW